MSYTRPRFYREDYGAFNKNLQASFTKHHDTMKGYFDEKIKERELYEADINAQAEEMRNSGENIENFASKTKEQIEGEIQKFISSAMTVTDKAGTKMGEEGFKKGLFMSGVKEQKWSEAKLDETNANFDAKIKGLNDITTEAFEKKFSLMDDYDKTSPTYLRFAGILGGLRGDFTEGGGMKMVFDEKTGKFDSELTIPNNDWTPKYIGDPKDKIINNDWHKDVNLNKDGTSKKETLTYSSNQLQSMLAENDNSFRVQHETRLTTLLDTAEGAVKTAIGASKAKGEAYVAGGLPTTGGVAYTSPAEIARQIQKLKLENTRLSENDPNVSNIWDDVFTNNVNFGTDMQLNLLGGGKDSDGEDIVGVEGGADLKDLVDGIKGSGSEGQDLSIQSNELLADLLDMGTDDIQSRRSKLKRLHELSGSAEPLDTFIEKQEKVLANYRDASTERYLTNEMMGRGIGSEYIKGRQVKDDGNGNGGTNGVTTDLRKVQIQDTTTEILAMGDEPDVEKIIAGFPDLDKDKLLPRNVVKKDDGSYDFEVKQGGMGSNWWKWGEDYDDDKISEADFKTYMNDPKFAAQYMEAIQGTDYGDVDPDSLYADAFDPTRLKEAEIKIDGGNRQVHDSQYDNDTGQLTIFMEANDQDPTAKNTKTYNLRTMNGYLSYYQDRMGAGTQKERDDLYNEGARQLVKDLVMNRYNTKGWGGDFPVEPLDMLDDGAVKSMYKTEKKKQDPIDYEAYYKARNKGITDAKLEEHMKTIMEGSAKADEDNNETYWDDLIRKLIGK